ncbi:MAG: cbb3-type cytochrome c oxidase subunit II [Sandaracinaceae bacterium]
MITRASLIFLGALAAILMSFTALAVLPSAQLATIEPTPGTEEYYGPTKKGREVYVREGCVYCHSQQVRPPDFGADIERGWGSRGSLPGDYVYDEPHVLGTMRTGPDLHDIASRQPSADWHHAHLYNPRSVSPGSVMAPYPWLYRVVEVRGDGPENAVPLPPEYAPGEGLAVVPTEEAEALYAYLMTLKLEAVDTPVSDATGATE